MGIEPKAGSQLRGEGGRRHPKQKFRPPQTPKATIGENIGKLKI